MSELSDPRIADLLDRLVPASVEQSNWKHVVVDAAIGDRGVCEKRSRPRWRSRGPLIALAVLAVMVIVPLTALAVGQNWWFLRFGSGPKPISPVVVVAKGTWDGVSWTLTAYGSATDGICTAFTPQASGTTSGRVRAITAGMGCAPISGVPATPDTKPSPPLAITYLMGEGNASFPGFVVGPVIASARTVEIALSNHASIRVPTISAPSALHAHVRFFVARLPAGLRWSHLGSSTPVTSLVGLDAHGRIVARLAIPGGANNSALYRMINHGVRVHFTAAFLHALRLARRSTDVLLLASRDGTNFYRSVGSVYGGVAHACFGVGKTVNLASLPPTRRGIAQMAGIIECSPATATTFPSPQQPVWDLSIYGQNRGQPDVTLFRLAGIASDAVRTVNLLDRNHHVVARVPVIDNVYTLRHVPEGVTLVVPTGLNGQSLAECGPNASARVRGSGTYLQARC